MIMHFCFRTLAATLLISPLMGAPAAASDLAHFGSTWLGGGDSVAEIQATADWYQHTFGMHEVSRHGTGTGRSLGVAMKFDGREDDVAMGITGSYAGVPGARADEFVRVAFNATGIDELKRRAIANGGSVKSESKHGEEMVTVLADPRGNLVELWSPKSPPPPAAEVDKSPDVQWRWLRIPAVDVPAAVAFYERVFGMQRTGSDGKRQIQLAFKSGAAPRLAIAQVEQRLRPTLTPAASQIVYRWAGLGELNGVLNRAYEQHAVHFLQAPYATASGSTLARVLDNQGNVIELLGRCEAQDRANGNEVCGK